MQVKSALDGIVVLDLTSYLAGPFGCALLGDQGAVVVKVEAPDGDNNRRYPTTLKGENRAFLAANRNKRSIRLDLKSPGGKDAFRRMVEQADVVVHNFRPSVPERLGIDYETLRELREDLVYCSITGYGERENGPLRDHPGFDTMLQCFTGMAVAQGGSSGVPQILGGSVVDVFTSTMVAQGVLAGLLHRQRTGEGQHVEVSLLRSAIACQITRFTWAENEPRDAARDVTGNVGGPTPTKDGYLFFQATTSKFWQALCEILELPELLLEPRYATVVDRTEHSEEIMPKIREALLRKSAAEWETLMLGKVPAIAVRGIGELFEHPQVLAEGLIAEQEHPVVGRYKTATTAIRMGTGEVATTRAPLAGEHTDEILREFRFTNTEIEHLRKEGAAL